MFRFGNAASVAVKLADTEGRGTTKATVRATGAQKELFVYQNTDPVSGLVYVNVPHGKKLEHQGVRVQLLGQIITPGSTGGTVVTFTDLKSDYMDLAPAGVLETSATYDFAFPDTWKEFESYYGLNVTLRYCIRVTVFRRNYQSSIEHDEEFAVQILQPSPETNPPIKMEVGIEDCLHIEFEYDHGTYHLNGCVEGRVYFLLVRIKIKYMEIAVIKRESAGSGRGAVNESETIIKYEVMDGVPVKGEIIPLRLYLKPLPLTPTFRNIGGFFSVKYYVNLVLVDEEDRRYFKQQEITMWRDELDGSSADSK